MENHAPVDLRSILRLVFLGDVMGKFRPCWVMIRIYDSTQENGDSCNPYTWNRLQALKYNMYNGFSNWFLTETFLLGKYDYHEANGF